MDAIKPASSGLARRDCNADSTTRTILAQDDPWWPARASASVRRWPEATVHARSARQRRSGTLGLTSPAGPEFRSSRGRRQSPLTGAFTYQSGSGCGRSLAWQAGAPPPGTGRVRLGRERAPTTQAGDMSPKGHVASHLVRGCGRRATEIRGDLPRRAAMRKVACGSTKPMRFSAASSISRRHAPSSRACLEHQPSCGAPTLALDRGPASM